VSLAYELSGLPLDRRPTDAEFEEAGWFLDGGPSPAWIPPAAIRDELGKWQGPHERCESVDDLARIALRAWDRILYEALTAGEGA